MVKHVYLVMTYDPTVYKVSTILAFSRPNDAFDFISNFIHEHNKESRVLWELEATEAAKEDSNYPILYVNNNDTSMWIEKVRLM